MTTSYDILCLPDMQVPYHDPKFIKTLTDFTVDYQPHVIANVGDLVDQPEPSRWNRGMAGEYAPTLQAGFDESHRILKGFRDAAPNAAFHVRMGNHDERVETYVNRYAPALASLDAVKYENLLRTPDLGIFVWREPVKIAPGWLLAHGHEANLNTTAGGTALGLAKRTGMSVVCGHTHKLGLQHHTTGYGGKVDRTLWGMEVGHAMDMGKASYLKLGAANWQQGFGILHVRGSKVYPEVVPVAGRSFTVEGYTYAW